MLDRTAGIFKSATSSFAANGSTQPDIASPKTSFAGSGSDEWFVRFARIALGNNAGLHLHHVTGYPERSCYYWARGERAPPTDFLRKLLHSQYGETFLLAMMEGCRADWWCEFIRHKRMGEAADRVS
jgi:hypothetical protein